jgi:hypothetical protein
MIKWRRMRWVEHAARMGEDERIWDIGWKAKWKEATRKNKMWVSEEY